MRDRHERKKQELAIKTALLTLHTIGLLKALKQGGPLKTALWCAATLWSLKENYEAATGQTYKHNKLSLAAKIGILGLHGHGLYKLAKQAPTPLLKAAVLTAITAHSTKEAWEAKSKLKQ